MHQIWGTPHPHNNYDNQKCLHTLPSILGGKGWGKLRTTALNLTQAGDIAQWKSICLACPGFSHQQHTHTHICMHVCTHMYKSLIHIDKLLFLKQKWVLLYSSINLFRLTVLFRPLRLIILGRVFQLAYQKRHLEKLTRRLVSGQNMFVFHEILEKWCIYNVLYFCGDLCFTN
jgi:hypothetical protein